MSRRALLAKRKRLQANAERKRQRTHDNAHRREIAARHQEAQAEDAERGEYNIWEA